MTDWERRAIQHLAGEIQVAAPACRDDNRDDNCEYPWEDAQETVRVPCEYNFPKIDDSSRNKAIVKLIRYALRLNHTRCKSSLDSDSNRCHHPPRHTLLGTIGKQYFRIAVRALGKDFDPLRRHARGQ